MLVVDGGRGVNVGVVAGQGAGYFVGMRFLRRWRLERLVAPLALMVSVGFLVAGSPEDELPGLSSGKTIAGRRPPPRMPAEDMASRRLDLGDQRLARGQYRFALRVFRAIVERRPNELRAKAGMGRALSGIGRCTDAMGWLEQVRGTEVWGAETALAVGKCHERTGDYDEARADYQEAIALDRTFLLAWYALAQLELKADRLDEAFELENQLLTFDDGARMAYMLSMWRERDEHGDARAWESWLDFNRLLDRNQGIVVGNANAGRVQADLLEGVLWLDAGDPIAAQAALFRAVAAQPQQVRARVYRAEAWRRMGLTEQALYEISDAWIVGPDAPVAQPVRAKIYADLGRMAEADAELAGYPDPGDPEWVAAAWYVADRQQNTAGRDAYATTWRALVADAERTLEVQRPFGVGP